MHSLARYSKRTTHTTYRACQSITIRFQALLTLCQEFFSAFPHGTKFAIGLNLYLGLEVDVPHFRASFPRYTTQELVKVFFASLTGLSPSSAFHSRKIQITNEDQKTILKHHIPVTFLQQIRFALFCVRSLLLTESQLISFPAGTKTFQFPALLLLAECIGEVAFGNLGFKGCMHLAQAYRSLPRPSSSIEPSCSPNSGTFSTNFYIFNFITLCVKRPGIIYVRFHGIWTWLLFNQLLNEQYSRPQHEMHSLNAPFIIILMNITFWLNFDCEWTRRDFH